MIMNETIARQRNGINRHNQTRCRTVWYTRCHVPPPPTFRRKLMRCSLLKQLHRRFFSILRKFD